MTLHWTESFKVDVLTLRSETKILRFDVHSPSRQSVQKKRLGSAALWPSDRLLQLSMRYGCRPHGSAQETPIEGQFIGLLDISLDRTLSSGGKYLPWRTNLNSNVYIKDRRLRGSSVWWLSRTKVKCQLNEKLDLVSFPIPPELFECELFKCSKLRCFPCLAAKECIAH